MLEARISTTTRTAARLEHLGFSKSQFEGFVKYVADRLQKVASACESLENILKEIWGLQTDKVRIATNLELAKALVEEKVKYTLISTGVIV